MKGSIPQTPTVSLKFKVVYHVKAQNYPEKIASKNINNNVIPPAFFEVVENISEGKFENFKNN